MSQAEIMELLDANPGKYYTTRQLYDLLPSNMTSISRCTTQLVKRDGYSFKYIMGRRSIRIIGKDIN